MNNQTPTAQSGPSERAIAQAFREAKQQFGGRGRWQSNSEWIDWRASEIDAKQPPAGARDAVSTLPMILWAMRNWADVADRCAVTEGQAPACIRTWADQIEAITGKADGAKPENPLAFLCDCGEAPDHMPYGYRWCVKNGGRQEGTTGTDGAYSPATQPAATGASNVVLDGEEEESHHGE